MKLRHKKASFCYGLTRAILMKRLSDDIGMNRHVIFETSDPRRLSATIAHIPPLSTQDLMAEISRFNREDPVSRHPLP